MGAAGESGIQTERIVEVSIGGLISGMVPLVQTFTKCRPKRLNFCARRLFKPINARRSRGGDERVSIIKKLRFDQEPQDSRWLLD